MTRLSAAVTSFAILGIGAGAYARSRVKYEPVDPSKSARLSSRIPCDGSTNPQEEISLATTFSPGGWERQLTLEEFDEKYCTKADLEFVCIMPSKTPRWRQEWSSDSSSPASRKLVPLDSCYKHGSKDAPKYLLTGWYKEGGDDPKVPWKQAVVKQVSAKPEVYAFADPNGGTARVEIGRR